MILPEYVLPIQTGAKSLGSQNGPLFVTLAAASLPSHFGWAFED